MLHQTQISSLAVNTSFTDGSAVYTNQKMTVSDLEGLQRIQNISNGGREFFSISDRGSLTQFCGNFNISKIKELTPNSEVEDPPSA